ncbi:MAG: hypothetical protein MJZ21_05085 [archaeon]|nr:hypothetical protein [archaeon]
MAMTVDSCNVLIVLTSLITLAFAIITGDLFYNGEYDKMFIPLVIGFVFVFLDFYCIEKRGDLLYGKHIDCPLN